MLRAHQTCNFMNNNKRRCGGRGRCVCVHGDHSVHHAPIRSTKCAVVDISTFVYSMRVANDGIMAKKSGRCVVNSYHAQLANIYASKRRARRQCCRERLPRFFADGLCQRFGGRSKPAVLNHCTDLYAVLRIYLQQPEREITYRC